jgi:hypothetical protein
MFTSVRAFVAGFFLFALLSMVNSVAFASDDPSDEVSANPQRPERLFVLFRPGTHAPPSVSANARAQLDKNEFQREFYFSRWVQLNDIDHASAAPGDRVLFEVSPGESFELVLSQVVIHTGDGGTFWYAKFPDQPASVLNITFSRPQGTNKKVAFLGAGLQVPQQGRLFQVQTADDLPGWAILREIKPGSGTHLDNSNDLPSAAEQEEMRKERDRLLGAEPGSK